MTKQIIRIHDNDSVTKKRLQNAIKRKRATLATVTSQHELLKMELETIKREYYLRVGNLFTRDNNLDLEIIKYKNILSLMRTGLSYKQALEKLQGLFFAEPEEELPGDETFSYEEFMHTMEDTSTTQQSLKELWKKAVMKFHPDLTNDPDEKKHRETIMKEINQAYTEGNYDRLLEIYNNNHVVDAEESTIEDLEKILVMVENMIIKMKQEISELKQTDWYGWKAKIRKAKKTGTDVFRELENALLDDIVKKMQLLSELKRQVFGKKAESMV